MAVLFACSSNDAAATIPPEAGADAPSRLRDAPAPVDSTTDDDAAVACSPQPLTATPMWHPPTPFNPSACTANQVNGFVQSCLNGSYAVCDAFRQQNPGCAACAYTSVDDPLWGPVVDNRKTNFLQINKGGCFALATGESDGTGCGGALQLHDVCLDDTCRGCFPLTTTLTPLNNCESDPQTDTVCASYVAQASVKCPKTAPPAAQKCVLSNTSFETNVTNYVALWCSPPDDAGVDAGDAGDAADE